MPSTPNRGYTYPRDGDPATVPADMAIPLTQIDADVQTLADEAGQLATEVGDIVPLNPDGTAPAALEAQIMSIAQENGLPAGDIPIFPTLAEAQEWEFANPGRVALTIEDQSPDTVPPSTPGTLSVLVADVYARLTASGAQDDRAITGYSFRVDSGSWSAWQPENTFVASSLARDTEYTFQHRVRDRGDNVVVGVAVQVRTLAESPVPYDMAVQEIAPPFYLPGNGLENEGWGATSALVPTNASQSGAPLAGWPDSRRITPGGQDRFTTGEPMPETSSPRPFGAAVVIHFDNFVADYTGSGVVQLGNSPGWAVVTAGKATSRETEWRILVGGSIGSELLVGPFSPEMSYTGTHVFGVDCDGDTWTYYADGVAVATFRGPGSWSGFRSGVYVPSGATGAIEWRGFVLDEGPLGASVHADLADKAGTA